jgi:hypothetical protein
LIRIDRRAVELPTSLRDITGDGVRELVSARNHFANDEQGNFVFRAYKAPDVKAALQALFKGKCAYCEGLYKSSAPVDIEHYRPKSGVEDDNSHPGYWWLAMDWENLLPSCIDCNRRRKHIIVTEGMTLEEAEQQRSEPHHLNSGKKDAFPIRGRRLMPKDKEFPDEDALLLDPTRRDPSSHLVFTLEPPSLILATQVDGAPNALGQASIQVYGLNRLGLVQDRTVLLNDLRYFREQVFRCIDCSAKALSAHEKQDWIEHAVSTMRQLQAYAKPDRRYSAMAAAFVARLKEDLQAAAVDSVGHPAAIAKCSVRGPSAKAERQ